MKKPDKSPITVINSKDNKSDAPMGCVYASPENIRKHKSEQIHSDDSSEEELKKQIEFLIQQGRIIEEEHATTEIRLRENKPKASKKTHRWSSDTVKFCVYCGEHNSGHSVCKSCGKILDIDIDPEATVTFCTSCEKSIPLFSDFCPFCGKNQRVRSAYPFNHAVSLSDTAEIQPFCPVCGFVMDSDAQFCPHCGTQLGDNKKDDSSMGCVYAAPGRSGFLSKLFGKKK